MLTDTMKNVMACTLAAARGETKIEVRDLPHSMNWPETVEAIDGVAGSSKGFIIIHFSATFLHTAIQLNLKTKS